MKTFGLVVPKGGGRTFEANVQTLLAGQEALAAIILPLLETWHTVRTQAARLDSEIIPVARASAPCQLMMTVPGIGAFTALAFASMIEDPANFKNARAVRAYVGLTARSYQSGEIDYDGHISKRGDKHVRSLLYEAAAIVLTRVRRPSALRSWGLKLMKRAGFKRAAVGVAHKLAIILHAMWRDGSAFNPKIIAA